MIKLGADHHIEGGHDFDTPMGSMELGGYLVQAGKIRPADVHRILHVQQEENLRFGEAAVRLGLVTEKDVQEALAAQFAFPVFSGSQQQKYKDVVAAHSPFSAEVEKLRALRTELVVRKPEEGDAGIFAVVSPGKAEGRSYIASNLAVLFAQIGKRTLLIDADLRNPCQHNYFHVDNSKGLSAVLSGRAPADSAEQPKGLANLFVMPSGQLPPNPLELLSRYALSLVLQSLTDKYDRIILDSPAGIAFADAQAVSAHAGFALMVTRRHQTPLRAAKKLAEGIATSGAKLIGTVITDY